MMFQTMLAFLHSFFHTIRYLIWHIILSVASPCLQSVSELEN